MATARDVQVNPDTNEVSVQFTVHDEDLANYLSEHDDSEQADVVERALRVGMVTLQLSETTKDVEHVKREFESLHSNFEKEIEQVRDELEETFGEDGELDEALTEHLGEDGTL
jgi:SMC interacting uncharacterized protein involved in chromosome segregation